MPGPIERRRSDGALGRRIRNDLGDRALLQGRHGFVASLLAFGLLDRPEFVVVLLPHQLIHRVRRRRLEGGLDRAHLVVQLALQGADLPDHVVGETDRRQHVVFGQFTSEPLDHRDFLFGAGHDQIQIAVVQLIPSGEGNQLALDAAHADRPDGRRDRERRNEQRRRHAIHRDHVAVVLAVAGKHDALTLDLVAEPLRKQGANRAVDQPRGQRVLHRRAAFPFDETARKLAGGSRAFPIVARQREEILLAVGRCAGHGVQHHGVTISGDDGGGSLLCEFSSFEYEGEFPNLFFYTNFHCFWSLLFVTRWKARGVRDRSMRRAKGRE